MKPNLRRILVFDDDNDSLIDCLSASLPLAYLIRRAKSEKDACRRLSREDTDLIVISTNHEPGSGIEVLRMIREKDNAVPALLLQSNGFRASEDEIAELGNCTVLTKPIFPRQFLSVIEAALMQPNGHAGPAEVKKRRPDRPRKAPPAPSPGK
jgi:two-component system phosphate regulon response regulator OmpR